MNFEIIQRYLEMFPYPSYGEVCEIMKGSSYNKVKYTESDHDVVRELYGNILNPRVQQMVYGSLLGENGTAAGIVKANTYRVILYTIVKIKANTYRVILYTIVKKKTVSNSDFQYIANVYYQFPLASTKIDYS